MKNSYFLQQITAYNNIIVSHPITYNYFKSIYLGQFIIKRYYI